MRSQDVLQTAIYYCDKNITLCRLWTKQERGGIRVSFPFYSLLL